ncbi:MAG: Cys-tRNA(Pro)/Cys-tRNA(Cys) deacylase YbaK [Planctomycetes bacterium ADurb.Bin126]|nr:MAG: Cys-tRNA(Pro)/Cys-tRNA(Cys) deacylase YbaK [Planctomycetes bacterium ADurb.Bin126]HQL72399.1 YbaK/EbsC family protein [Phycisphaerae bacterium]
MKIQEYLEQHGVSYQRHEHAPAYTAQEVAAEEHVSGNMLAKGVLVKADEDFVLCVLPASFKLDMEKVGQALKARRVRLADENELARCFPDAEVGAEPPFGSLYNLSTLVDRHLADNAEIVFQSGSHREVIRMHYADYASLVRPQVIDLAVRAC